MRVENKLSELRHKRGLSAAELAAEVGVSRQTIHSMEAGSFVPNTLVALKLARVFGVRVEDLFRIEEELPPSAHAVTVEWLPGPQPPQPGQPVQLCQVGNKMVAACPEPANWILPPVDAVVVDVAGRTTARLLNDDLGKRLMVAGCDPGISVLSRHLQREGVELVVVYRNSSQSLDLLKRGLVHIAGCHLKDEATGESNLPAVRRRFRANSVAVIGFAVWEEGIVVVHGNPRRIQSIPDFARPDVTIVNREPGAGCRLLLDSNLERLGIASGAVNGYDQIALGHLPAAWHVSTGKADCAIATKAAARAFGLGFIPLLTERYDLVIRKADLDLPAVQTLLDTLGRAAFRREIEGLGGYDTRTAGDRLA